MGDGFIGHWEGAVGGNLAHFESFDDFVYLVGLAVGRSRLAWFAVDDSTLSVCVRETEALVLDRFTCAFFFLVFVDWV